LTAEDVPANATFTDNGDGTGTFDFDPDYTQASIYNVRFIASDGALADTEIVAITVDDAGNQAPVLAAIGPQGVTEGDNLNFGVSASDLDATTPTLTAEDVPTNAIFDDNGDGTGTFDFDPDFTQGGSIYSVRFIASDGVLADTEVVDITVADEGNQAPVLEAIGPQSVVEGDSLSVGVSATDPDATMPILTAEDVPANATFTDNGDGTGVFDFSPNFVQSDVYDVTFIASDGVLADTEVVTITVIEAGNQAPVIADIDSQFVAEGLNLNFVVLATDPDTTIPTISAEDIPINATFIDNGDGSGTFDFSPDSYQAGEYTVRFIAADGALNDTHYVVVTVNDINQAPTLDPIGPRVVNIGDTLNFTISAVDPDSTIPALSADSLPVNAIFTDLLDGTGVFNFESDSTQEGVYHVVFVTSDGLLADTEVVQISVTDFNQPPSFADIDSQVVFENGTLELVISAVDPEGHGIELYLVDGPNNSTFTDSGNGAGLFSFEPDYYQAGEYVAAFAAVDDGDPQASGVLSVPITVVDVNQPPEFETVDPLTVLLGDSIMLRLVASDSTDPDGGALLMSALSTPDNSTHADSGNGIAGFVFTPELSQVGVDTAIFICYDDEDPALSGLLYVEITVVLTNLPPELDPVGPQTVIEADTLEFNVYATDTDGPSLTLYTEELPTNAAFVDSGNGVGTFTFVPSFMQAGLESVKFYATDGLETVFITVLIQVYDNPQPPDVYVVDDTTITEGEVLDFLVWATDPDSTIPTIRIDTLVFPLNLTFVDSGNGVASFHFAPVFIQAGIYDFSFIAEDETEMVDTDYVSVTVLDAGNQYPLLTHIMKGPTQYAFTDTFQLIEGETINFDIFSTDADSIIPVLSASGLPGSALFTDNLDFTGSFNWETSNFDADTHTVSFYAIDGDDPLLVDSAKVTIIVINVNHPPSAILVWRDGQYMPTGSEEVDSLYEGEVGVYLIEMVDPDNTFPELQIDALQEIPPDTNVVPMFNNVVPYDSGNGFGTLTFSPDYYQSRYDPYAFRIRAFDVDDDSMFIEKIFRIGVGNVPQVPVLDPIPASIQLTEGDSLDLVISYLDADLPSGSFLTLTYEPVLANSGVANIDGNSSQFHFYPWFDQAGNYELLFRVEENQWSFDTQTVAIEVLEAGPQPPILSVPFAPEHTVNFGNAMNERISAIDPESQPVTLSAINVPVNATFVDSGNGAGSFYFNPDISQVDMTFDVGFIASDGVLADTVYAALYVQEFVCGDANGSNDVDIDDVVFLLQYMFADGPAPDPLISGDVDCSGEIDIDDVVHLIEYIFGDGTIDCTCP
jgi:hypothetical protein